MPGFVKFGVATTFAGHSRKSTILYIEIFGEPGSRCTDFVNLVFPTAAFNTAKTFFHDQL
jgi:hypothetical protein